MWFDGSGVANDGEPFCNSYAWFLILQGGSIIRVTAFFDAIAFGALWRRVTPVSGS